MNYARILALLALAFALAACGGAATTAPSMATTSEQAPGAPATGGGASTGADALEKYDSQPAAEPGQPAQSNVERLVIKTADLSLQVASAREAEANLRTLVGQLGGYVVKVETSGTDNDMTSRVTFRVPAARFDDALAGAQGIANKVLSRTVGGDDVTEEFVDLDSRLRNLEATRDRLLSFLAKADNVEDALKVNESLSQIQGEIEQVKGRRQFLQQSAALSTITVYFTPVPTTPILTEDGWQPATVARRALRDLVEFGQGLASVAIVVLVWAPVWLTLLAAGFVLRRFLVRRVRRPATPPSGPSTPEAA